MATLTSVQPQSRFGTLELSERDEVVDFSEKPQMSGWISTGYFVFERQVFDYLSTEASCILEREPLEALARDGQLMAYRHNGFFFGDGHLPRIPPVARDVESRRRALGRVEVG